MMGSSLVALPAATGALHNLRMALKGGYDTVTLDAATVAQLLAEIDEQVAAAGPVAVIAATDQIVAAALPDVMAASETLRNEGLAHLRRAEALAREMDAQATALLAQFGRIKGHLFAVLLVVFLIGVLVGQVLP